MKSMTEIERARKADRMLRQGDDPFTAARLCGFKNVPALLRALRQVRGENQRPEALRVIPSGRPVDVLGDAERGQIRAAGQADALEKERRRIDWKEADARRQSKTLFENEQFRVMKTTKERLYMITQKHEAERVVLVTAKEIPGLIELLQGAAQVAYAGEDLRTYIQNREMRVSRTQDRQVFAIRHRGTATRVITVHAKDVAGLIGLLTQLGAYATCAQAAE